MGINKLLKAFNNEYSSLSATDPDYEAKLKALLSKYNLDLDARLIALGKGDPLSLDDSDAVKKRMKLNQRRDALYALRDSMPDVGSTALELVGNVFTKFQELNSNSNTVNQSQVNPIKNVFDSTNALISEVNLNKTIPDNALKSGPSLFAKQGIKIEYMNLFK